MNGLEQIFSKNSEIHDIFKQFEAIKNIYDNSLIAMGEKYLSGTLSSSTSTYLSQTLIINSNKGE